MSNVDAAIFVGVWHLVATVGRGASLLTAELNLLLFAVPGHDLFQVQSSMALAGVQAVV